MKTLYYSIIIILLSGTFGFGAAYAEQPLLKFYNNSDRVLAGKIISLSQVPTMTGDTTQYPNQTRYDVQVEEYYKDPQDFKLVTVYGYAKGIYFAHDPTFDVGDRVFLYLVKKNGFYQIQFPSFKLDNNCDARSMVPMSILPFESPPIATPAAGNFFNFIDSFGNNGHTFKSYAGINVNFVAENYMPVVKHETLNFSIKTDNDTKLVFNDTKQVTIPACNGQVPISLEFTPERIGIFSVYVTTSGSIDLGHQSILFTEPRVADGFLVKDNPSSVKIDKAPYSILSPLKQFESGIKPEYVKCSQDLHLILKAEDGSFACVKIETGKNLVKRGWATTFGTGISTNDYYTKCDTLYPQSNTGIAVFYMPTNSIGKICVRYYNVNNTPTGIGMRIFDADNLTQNASNVTAWTDDSTLKGNANKTIVYFIKTGTKVGFYGVSLNCGGFPLAVGYDANSTISASDFPWIGQVFNCGVITYDSHIEGTTGIGVKYIPSP